MSAPCGTVGVSAHLIKIELPAEMGKSDSTNGAGDGGRAG